MLTFRLILEDGTPADLPVFVSSVPNWNVGDTAIIRPGLAYRIVEVRAADDVSGEWVVEAV